MAISGECRRCCRGTCKATKTRIADKLGVNNVFLYGTVIITILLISWASFAFVRKSLHKKRRKGKHSESSSSSGANQSSTNSNSQSLSVSKKSKTETKSKTSKKKKK